MASGAAKRYTEAVFDIARDKGSFDQWQQDLDALAGLMSDDGAALVLNSPKISRAQKMSLFQEALRSFQPAPETPELLINPEQHQQLHRHGHRALRTGTSPWSSACRLSDPSLYQMSACPARRTCQVR